MAPGRVATTTVVATALLLGACSSDDSDESTPKTAASASDAFAPRPPGFIIDTDLSEWWDDASAVGIANVLHDQGRIRLLGIMSDVPNDIAVAALDAINTAYGHDDLPLGALPGSDADTFEHGYTDAVIRRLPHDIDTSDDALDAVTLYRQLLADEPDQSVTIVSLGGYTNLAGLLESSPDDHSPLDGRELVAAKVERLVQMDGLFPDGGPAFTNQAIDPAAAGAVVAEDGWPTPIAWVDGYGGVATLVGQPLCTETSSDHPMRVVYEALFDCEPPDDGNWDVPTLLYAVGDLDHLFTELGHGGAAFVNERGGLSWRASSTREGDRYVRVADQETLNRRIDSLLVASGS